MNDRTPVSRVILVVMDSVGVGEQPDAHRYGDEGSNTVAHVHATVPLAVPALRALGLAQIVDIGDPRPIPTGAFGRMTQASAGKDSVTGHWELAGVVLDRPFPTFPYGFPREVIAQFERRIGRQTLGNKVASGTDIVAELGAEHVRTGWPIIYTSADSVFQIAAHEDVVPLDELYRMCAHAFDLVARGLGVARVIARPFVGGGGKFERTANRRDFAVEPEGYTLLDAVREAGHDVLAIGKIEDLFAGRGIARSIRTKSDADGLEALEHELRTQDPGLVVANFVDFDTRYGHRNDAPGYAANLERFDMGLARICAGLHDGDLLVVTADHGNDPTTTSTDHSREFVPVLVTGAAVRGNVDLGTRATFADLGQTVADVFGVQPLANGVSFLADILRTEPPGDEDAQ